MNIVYSTLGFLITIGVLVTLHELGHYWAARLFGVRALVFSVGLGKLFWSRVDKHGTRWGLAPIPLGGYVKLADWRDPDLPSTLRADAMQARPIWQRSVILAAGPAANFLVAILFFWVLYQAGVPAMAPIIDRPAANTPAAAAGFARGERVLTVDGEAISTFAQLDWALVQAALDKRGVVLQVRDENGYRHERTIDFSALETKGYEEVLRQRIGLDAYQPDGPAKIGKVAVNSAAALAGLSVGDQIISINQVPVKEWRDIGRLVGNQAGTELSIEARKPDGEVVTVLATPQATTVAGAKIGRLGIGWDLAEQKAAAQLADQRFEQRIFLQQLGPLDALARGVEKTASLTAFTLTSLWRMIKGEVSLKSISGPVTIADHAGESIQAGPFALLEFLALVSVSIGVLNLLPVPLLDGGQLLYHLIEFIRGKPLSESAQAVGHQVGFAMIILLGATALFNDFSRL